LAEEQRQEILDLAIAEAEANAGMPAVFAVCEAIRTWLADNNVKGQDDGSMYAQMMRRAKEAEREKAKAAQVFEAQKKQDQLSQAELEEMAVRKRRAEGTPCTKENFLIWLETWDEEMENKQEEEKEEEKTTKGKSKEKIVDYSTRMTGFEYFSGKGGLMNLDAIEAAVNEADEQAVDVDDLDVDEDLFDDDDDLDDLDFDESDEDDSDDEPEI